MIEKIKSPLDLKVGNYKGTEFDIIPADTFAMVCRKINELVDAINILQCKNVHIESDLQDLMYPKEIKGELGENVQDEMPRCPFCGEELYYAQEIDGGFEILTCNCPAGIWLFGNDKMWYNLEKIITELERTRKVLDKAKWWLNEIVKNHRYTPISTAEMALKEIIALEQKE